MYSFSDSHWQKYFKNAIFIFQTSFFFPSIFFSWILQWMKHFRGNSFEDLSCFITGEQNSWTGGTEQKAAVEWSWEMHSNCARKRDQASYFSHASSLHAWLVPTESSGLFAERFREKREYILVFYFSLKYNVFALLRMVLAANISKGHNHACLFLCDIYVGLKFSWFSSKWLSPLTFALTLDKFSFSIDFKETNMSTSR